jgi:hypothetical protein
MVKTASITCGARSIRGKPCKRKCLFYGPMCWQHTALLQGVRIGPSTVPLPGNRTMNGLYATRDFKRNEAIAEYTGEIINKAENDRRYPGVSAAAYVIRATADRYIDALKTNSGIARYANDCEDVNKIHTEKLMCNADFAGTFHLSGITKKIVLRAVHAIVAGDEILVDYGDGYWSDAARTNKSARQNVGRLHNRSIDLSNITRDRKLPRIRKDVKNQKTF